MMNFFPIKVPFRGTGTRMSKEFPARLSCTLLPIGGFSIRLGTAGMTSKKYSCHLRIYRFSGRVDLGLKKVPYEPSMGSILNIAPKALPTPQLRWGGVTAASRCMTSSEISPSSRRDIGESTAIDDLPQSQSASKDITPSAYFDLSADEDVARLASITADEGSNSTSLLEQCARKANSSGGQELDVDDLSLPVEIMRCLILSFKDNLDFPWWASICLTALLLRLIFVPLSIYSERHRRRMTLFRPQLQWLETKQEEARKADDKTALEGYRKRYMDLRKKKGISLFPRHLFFVAGFQFPFLICYWKTIRNLANHPGEFKDFALESPFWLNSLSLADPYMILPVLTSAFLMLNWKLSQSTEQSLKKLGMTAISQKEQKNIKDRSLLPFDTKWLSLLSCFIVIPLTSSVPSGLFFYILLNVMFQSCLSIVCRISAVERFFGLPLSSSKPVYILSHTRPESESSEVPHTTLRGIFPFKYVGNLLPTMAPTARLDRLSPISTVEDRRGAIEDISMRHTPLLQRLLKIFKKSPKELKHEDAKVAKAVSSLSNALSSMSTASVSKVDKGVSEISFKLKRRVHRGYTENF